MLIKKEDIVQVMTGDDAGTSARVLRVLPHKNKIVVEGVNRVYRHMKPNRRNAQGGRLSKECAFCYELRLHRARGYGALKAILEILADVEGLTLTEISQRLQRTPGSTKDYLSWLEDVDLVASKQKRYSFTDPLPEYRLVGAEGPDHRKQFQIAVAVRGEVIAEAGGTSKKEAEQEGARLALEKLRSTN